MESLIPRLFTPPKASFFLFGPRGTGKTTWLRHIFPESLYLDLLEADSFRAYSARPERLREAVQAAPKIKTVIIDEVQKVPQLLDVVHALMERKDGRQYILTGSGSRKLKRAGVDLLAGRALRLTLHPFMAAELGPAFRLERALDIGMIPLVVGSPDPEAVLRSYAALYVREEVQMEGLVRNVGNFSRFLEAVSFSHGAVLNISNVARECQVERKVVESYLGILEDLMLAYRLPVFSKRARRAVIAHPKFYLYDAGLFRSLRPSGPLDRPEEIGGAALEGLVSQHLVAWNSYRGERNKLYYWRTTSGTEIDFVIYGPDVFWAIEVKNGRRVDDRDLIALRSFGKEYPKCGLFFLHRGNERLLKDGILCLPCEEFLSRLDPKKIRPDFD